MHSTCYINDASLQPGAHYVYLCAGVAPLVFFFFFFFISFLAPSSASIGLKRSPHRRSIVTTISVLELWKLHSHVLKYIKPQSLHGSQGDASLSIGPIRGSTALLREAKPAGRLG